MTLLRLALLLLAVIFEVLAAASVPSGRLNMIAAGLACYFLSLLVV